MVSTRSFGLIVLLLGVILVFLIESRTNEHMTSVGALKVRNITPPPPFRETCTRFGESDDLFSSVQCQASCCNLGARNRTCWYKNLYIKGKKFYYYGKPGLELPRPEDLYVFLSSRTWGLEEYLGGIKIKEIKNEYTTQELEAMQAAKVQPGLHVMLNTIDINIGHSVFDNMIVAWQQLLRWNISDIDFVWVLSLSTRKRARWPKAWKGPEWLEKFSGKKMLFADLSSIGDDNENDFHLPFLYRFNEMIMGGGASGLVSVDQNFASFANPRSLEILRHYRNRVYSRFGIERREANKTAILLNVTWALTKRRLLVNWEVFKSQLEKTLPIQLNVIHWENYSYVQQIQLLSTTNILVSGVGTSQLNQVYLQDGSVFINLGAFDCESPSGYFQSHNYRDVQIQPGMTYVWPIFFRVDNPLTREDFHEGAHILYYNEIESVLNDAVAIFRKGFSIPIPLDVAYPPHEKACRDIFQRDKTVWLRHILQLMPGHPYEEPYVVPEPYYGMDTKCMGYCKTILEVEGAWNTSDCPVDRCMIMRARNEFMKEHLAWPGCN